MIRIKQFARIYNPCYYCYTYIATGVVRPVGRLDANRSINVVRVDVAGGINEVLPGVER